jgi:hypothetical protein
MFDFGSSPCGDADGEVLSGDDVLAAVVAPVSPAG